MILTNPSTAETLAAEKPTGLSYGLPVHTLTGYWHNWQSDAARFIRLGDIPLLYDVILVAFAIPDKTAHGKMVFTPYPNASEDQFKSDVARLQSFGKKVLISVGGANGSAAITDSRAQHNFCASALEIVERYGFDGIDINLENKIVLVDGDTDLKEPQSPSITNLIDAVREIRSNFGLDFIVSMTPETINVQGGYSAYRGDWGSYLPVIDGLRDILTYVHVQHYNSAPMMALDGNIYAQGTADFLVALSEMLFQGFSLNGNARHVFPALKPEQIAIGLPASAKAAGGGYTTPAEVQKALNYLTRGVSFGGKYSLCNPSGYPTFKGIMTWSINWDAANCLQFSRSIRRSLDALP